jgi:hypothetical protein
MRKLEPEVRLRPRPAEAVSLNIPLDTLESLKAVAESRDMSLSGLLKFYIGQGLRQDLTQLFADRVLATTTAVLTRHLQSEEEVTAIVEEIRKEAGGRSVNE